MAATQPKPQTNEEVADELIISGYLRDMFNDDRDYSFIVAIIILFYQQGYAKYYDENIDKDYKQKMRFGDILMTKNDYMVLDSNNKLQRIGEYYEDSDDDEPEAEIDITVPFSICQHLTDAVTFYSNLNQINSFKEAVDYYLHLEVKHDDKWLIKQLNGPLKPEYELITLRFDRMEIYSVDVRFKERCFKRFYTFHLAQRFHLSDKITAKDIDMYYKIRTDTTQLVKFRISMCILREKWAYTRAPGALSVLWEKNYDYIDEDPLRPVRYVYYIGPLKEKNKMINELRSFYSKASDESESEWLLIMCDFHDRDWFPTKE